ncbi:unnamed protein product, partial [Ectocarpus sp. 8 AP-2014]
CCRILPPAPYLTSPLSPHTLLHPRPHTPHTPYPALCHTMTRVGAIAAFAAGFVQLSFAHIMQKYPMSRQLSYGIDFKAWDDPEVEFCPHCYNARGPKYVKQRAYDNVDSATLDAYGGGEEFPLYFGDFADNGNYLETNEIAKRHGVCGDPEQNADEGTNVYSTANINWDPLDSFTSGQVLEMDIVMNAYHWGHCEFFVCNTDDMDDPDGVPTQECFNMNPLTRADDDGDASPIDPNYPGRYYVDPECREEETEQSSNSIEGYNIKMRYVLPDIECEHCILQMVYYTGNTCKHIGYEEFNPPSWPSSCAPNKWDWIELDRYVCGTRGRYPEEFWACSDFSMTSDGSAPAPTPADAPMPDPVDEEDDDDSTDGGMEMYEYVGCYTDRKDDRVLGDKLNSDLMTADFCYEYCSEIGAAYMATQYAFECFCSADEDLDYERHGTAMCDMACWGDEGETCGGENAFDLYRIMPSMDSPTPATPFSEPEPEPITPVSDGCAEAWGQCGGGNWEGSTCCMEGYECVANNDWYSQVRGALSGP